MNNLALLVKRYVDAANAQDARAVAACFLSNGTVHDEGSVHRGHASIAAWASDTAARYGSRIEPKGELEQDGTGRCMLRASVSGNFPGSPAMFAFHFVLQAEGIDSLEITA